jgi:hypothetical protein
MLDGDEMTPEEHKQNVREAFNKISGSVTKKINCANLDLTSDEFKELVSILKDKEFETLDLRYNGIDISYIESLQNIIINNPQLKEIDLEGNNINDEAIIKLLDNAEVCKRLSNIYIKFFINPYGEKGLIAAGKYMSPHTIGMMTSSAQIKDKALAASYDDAVGKYLRQESKEESSLPFNLFLFKQLEKEKQFTDEFKDPAQADKLQKNNTITSSPRKNS